MTIATNFSANAAGALAQALQYSFFPGSNAAHYAPRVASTTVFGAIPAAATAVAPAVVNPGVTDYQGFRHTEVQGHDQIAHINMTEGITGRGTAVSVRPTLANRPRHPVNDPPGVGPVAVPAPPDSFPAYFLPWDGRGAIVELTIPPYNALAAQPNFFFTAVLSGCTIHFCGPPNNPTIYHCGTEGVTGGGAPTVGDSNVFFYNMLRRGRIHLGLGRQGGALATDNRRVLSTDYLVPAGGGGVGAVGLALTMGGIFGTQSAYFTGRRFHLDRIVPWGSVFGVRNAGTHNFDFYLQVNGTFMYNRIETEYEWGSWGVIPWRVGRDTHVETRDNPLLGVAKPLFTRKVFPAVDPDTPGVRGAGIV